MLVARNRSGSRSNALLLEEVHERFDDIGIVGGVAHKQIETGPAPRCRPGIIALAISPASSAVRHVPSNIVVSEATFYALMEFVFTS